MKRRFLYALLAAVVLVLVVAQIALPPIASDRIVSRLTERGGRATASVSAFPAIRLLFGSGDQLSAYGSGLDLSLESPTGQSFQRLDQFGDVSVHVTDSTAGPFHVGDFVLTRSSPDPYHLVATASATPHALLAYGADQLGFFGGLALQFGGDQLLGGDAGTTIPIKLDMSLASVGGRVVVAGGGSTVGGIPTGPLGAAITSAIANSV
jgi:hypothetical protein